MLQINQAFQELTPEEYERALDLPVWIALLAAYAHEGVISENERAAAIRMAYLRTYRSPEDIRDYSLQVYRRFDTRFDELNNQLPGDEKGRMEFIKKQVREIYILIGKLDPSIQEDVYKSMNSFYRHVFQSDRSFIQYFALPVVSGHLDKIMREEGPDTK